MKIMDKISKKEFSNLVEKYGAKITKQTEKEITVRLKNNNWFNIYFWKSLPQFEKGQEIVLSSNLDFFGYAPFKARWNIEEDIFSFISECVFPTLNVLNGYFSYNLEEICSFINHELEKQKIPYNFEEKLFSFTYWNREYAKKNVLEYDGFVYAFSYNKKNIRVYIQLSKFIYIEIENSDGEKIAFPWFYFVNPHEQGQKSLETLFYNLFEFIQKER